MGPRRVGDVGARRPDRCAAARADRVAAGLGRRRDLRALAQRARGRVGLGGRRLRPGLRRRAAGAVPQGVGRPGRRRRARRSASAATPPGTCPSPSSWSSSTPRCDPSGSPIGNDVSSRSIEGENPLYLPQAKVYERSCALGPCVVAWEDVALPTAISLEIVRAGSPVFGGETSTVGDPPAAGGPRGLARAGHDVRPRLLPDDRHRHRARPSRSRSGRATRSRSRSTASGPCATR